MICFSVNWKNEGTPILKYNKSSKSWKRAPPTVNWRNDVIDLNWNKVFIPLNSLSKSDKSIVNLPYESNKDLNERLDKVTGTKIDFSIEISNW